MWSILPLIMDKNGCFHTLFNNSHSAKSEIEKFLRALYYKDLRMYTCNMTETQAILKGRLG